MQSSFGRKIALSLSLVLVLMLVQGTALAQYKKIILTSDQPGAPWLDPHLVNPWGLAFAAGSPIWVSDNVTGLSTLYNGQGVPQSLVVRIASANGTSKGSPTGIVFNGSGDFVVSKNGASGHAVFIFATLDGTISGWSPGVSLDRTVIAVDNSASGTVYTGLAIASDINWIYAADSSLANNRVNVYDGRFNLVTTLTDPSIPAGFTPYGIKVINKEVYVTYASPTGAPGGLIDVFGEFGNFIKRLASGGTLNQPWGLALAPSNFGPFSNALLVGNNLPNGTINAFNVQTGKFLGQLKNQAGETIIIDQLWGLAFGLGGAANGPTNVLFFTAGTDNYGHGRFGKIEFPR